MDSDLTYNFVLVLDNQTSNYLTLNTTSVEDSNIFLTDDSYSVASGAQATVVTNSRDSGSSTYNISQSTLLKVTWTYKEGTFTCAASCPGSTEYTVTGYDSPVTTETEYDWYTTFTLTVSSTTTTAEARP